MLACWQGRAGQQQHTHTHSHRLRHIARMHRQSLHTCRPAAMALSLPNNWHVRPTTPAQLLGQTISQMPHLAPLNRLACRCCVPLPSVLHGQSQAA